MSFFEDASLVYIPSAVKSGKTYSVKPTDGTGDLTFTRASDATRVASNGLIEKVRTNLVLQSNTFTNAAWFTSGATITAGQPDPFGGNNAFLVDFSGATTDAVSQNVSMVSGAPYTLSVWIKGVDLTALRFNVGANLVVVTSQITNGTWVRVSASATAGSTASLINGIRAGNSLGESFFIYGAQLETGDIATDYIATTSAEVSVGPVSGLPRLDYLNSTCPRLLLEPQRTNLVLYSEQFDNAYHTKNQASVTANAATSPDGYTNADKLIPNTTSTDDHRLSGGTLTVVSGSAYTTSVFVKNGGYNVVSVRSAAGKTVQVNLTTGVAIAYGSPTATSVVNYGNGWYRVSITDNASSTSYAPAILVQNSTASQYPIWAGNGTDGILIYGFQVELGAYPSSYLNTLSTSVTRVADAASKTGISSLIGSAAGTIYLEASALANDLSERRIALSDGTTSNVARVGFTTTSNRIIAVLYNGTNQCVLVYDGADITQTNKIAFTWSANDFALFVNGVKRSSDVFGTTFAANTLTRFGIDRGDGSGDATFGSFDQVLLFKSRLSDSDLATLTA